MSRNLEILLTIMYNLVLFGGICYLIQVYDWSPWTLFWVLILGASWKNDPKVTVETGK